MRLHEFTANPILTEQMLEEAFLDSVKQAIGNKIKDQINVVNNASTALQVIYKCITNADHLELVTFQLKKAIKTKLKAIANSTILKPIAALATKYFPQGRKIKDFITGLILVSVLNATMALADQAKDGAQSEAIDTIVDKLKDFAGLVADASTATGLFGVLDGLKIGNTLFFKLLTGINQKIENTAMAESIEL